MWVTSHAFSWLRVVERVRTAVEEYEGYISIPRFTGEDLVY